MKRFLLIAGCILSASFSCADYSGYTYRRTIVIDYTKVGTHTLTYTDFPVLVSTDAITLSTSASEGHLSNSSGYDLIFSTMNDCSWKLKADTETINNTGTATLNVWVKIPSISSATNTTFYVCYGSSTVTSYQGDSASAWDSNTIGVYHFANGSTLSGKDSTANGLTLTSPNGATATSGLADGAVLLSTTSSQYMQSPNTSDFNFTTVGTVSAWVYIPTLAMVPPSYSHGVIGKNDEGTGLNGYYLGVRADGTIYADIGNNLTYLSTPSQNAITAGSWHHVAFVWDTIVYLYIDGVRDPHTNIRTVAPTSYVYKLAVGAEGNVVYNFLAGKIDEVRMEEVARSEGWMKTVYNSISSPITFMAIGVEEGSASSPSGNAFFFGEF